MQKKVLKLKKWFAEQTNLPLRKIKILNEDKFIHMKAKMRYKRPLALAWFSDEYAVILPSEDWKELEETEVSIETYLKSVQWYVGFCRGGWFEEEAYFFKPLTKGLRNGDYLADCNCYNQIHITGVPKRECTNCRIGACPVKTEKKEFLKLISHMDWDPRNEFYSTLKRRILREQNIIIDRVDTRPQMEENVVEIVRECDLTTMFISSKFQADLLYFPADLDWNKVAGKFKIEIS